MVSAPSASCQWWQTLQLKGVIMKLAEKEPRNDMGGMVVGTRAIFLRWKKRQLKSWGSGA